ncbi:MAG: TonB-dependent receptor plug domain-containing protein [Bacteroidales bacterium]
MYIGTIAQTSFSDTIFQIKEVQVYANLRDAHAVGATIQTIDTISLQRFNNRSISDLLSTSGVNIKSYGLGGLSSIVMRGGSSSHTTIVWNGLNIQNPMNGSTNLSLLPVNMFNSVRLQYGGSGTLYGSGAVTGILHLSSDNSIHQPNKFSTSVGYGSGNTKTIAANAKWGTERYAISIKGYLNKADNDFKFINTTKIHQDKEKITNAEVDQEGILGDLNLKFNKNLSWNLSGWYQFNDKNLQTLMSSSTPSEANQVDKNLLASSNLKWNYNVVTLSLRNGLMHGVIEYSNPLTGENTENKSISWINELEARIPLRHFGEIITGVNYTNELAKSDAYLHNARRNRISLFSSYKIRFLGNKLTYSLSARDEVIDSDFKPLIFSVGSDYNFTKMLKLKANLSRNYRVPTLNDLYWAPSSYAEGNLNLKSEYGWSGELGAEQSFSNEKNGHTVSVTTFWTNIDNCITWLSDPSTMGKWKPYNIDNLKTYGLETRADLHFKVDQILFILNGFYAYTHSRIYGQENYDGKPLIYVPKHKFNGTVQLFWNGFGVSYSHLFNGERYKDYTSTLPYFNVGDLNVEYRFNIRPAKVNLRFTVNNIWNEDYQMVANYAMPLRNYFLTMTIDFM